MTAIKPTDAVRLRYSQKAHPHVCPNFESCTGDPITLQTFAPGYVMKTTKTQRALVQYHTADGDRFGWTDFRALEIRVPSAPVTLSSGRTVIHTLEPNGSQLATVTPGNAEFTGAEWSEYALLCAAKGAAR